MVRIHPELSQGSPAQAGFSCWRTRRLRSSRRLRKHWKRRRCRLQNANRRAANAGIRACGRDSLDGELPRGRELVQGVDAQAEVVSRLLRVEPAVPRLPRTRDAPARARRRVRRERPEPFPTARSRSTAICSQTAISGRSNGILAAAGMPFESRPRSSNFRLILGLPEGFSLAWLRIAEAASDCRVLLCAGSDRLGGIGAFRAGCRHSGATRYPAWQSNAANLGFATPFEPGGRAGYGGSRRAMQWLMWASRSLQNRMCRRPM